MIAIIGNLLGQYVGEGVFLKMSSPEEVVPGYYMIVARESRAMNATITAGWIQTTVVSPINNEIINPSSNLVWEIAEDQGLWTIRNVFENVYVSFNGTSMESLEMTSSVTSNNQRWHLTWNVSEVAHFIRNGNHNRILAQGQNLTDGFRNYGTSTPPAQMPVFYKLHVVPVISNVTHITVPPLANQPLSISATVTYASEGEFSVILKYNIEDTESSSPMSATGDIYTANLPVALLTDGTRVEFRIEVIYDTDKTVLSPEQRFFVGTTPIIKLRENIENGMPKHLDYLVGIKGVALNSQGVISSADIDFMIQDATAGVGVYSDTSGFLAVTAGNEYVVVGTLDQFNGRTLIVPQNITDLGISSFPEPYINTASFFTTYGTAEMYEGRLIKIKNINLAEGAVWPVSGETASVDLTDGTGSIVIRVLAALHGAGPTFPADVVAMLSQFSNDVPHHTGYQIFVRGLDDFYPTDVLPVTLTAFTAAATTDGKVNITWSTESESNMLGYKILRNETIEIETANYITPSYILAQNTPITQNYGYIDTEITYEIEYFYWLVAFENSGNAQFFGPVFITMFDDGTDPGIVFPTKLSVVYPNPAKVNSQVSFVVTVKEDETASFKIFNIRGQLVREFADILSGKDRIISWDGKDSNSREISSGIYFYQLSSPSYFSVKRMVIIR